MDFSLSSSLVGSAVSNPDKLALDLQFAADKTLTARKGPTPAFTRGSSATFVDSDGLIKYGAENLYNHSQNFVEPFWTKTRSSIQADSAIAPDGTLTADKFIEDTSITNTHTIGSSVTPTLIPYVLSVFAKKGERDWIILRLGAVNTFFNLNSGTFVASTNPAAITDVGNGWYRCSVISSAGTQGSFQLSTDGITNSYTGDGTSGIFIWGAQLERSSTVRTYIPTTTAVVYGPRFDHDPVTLACKGLLIEESRTNLVFPSDTLTTQTRTVTAVAHTLSFYGTGTVVLSGVAIATVVGSGVYPARTTLTFTPTAGSLILTVTGTVKFAQLETGSFPTSYIPTTTSSVIRSADVCSITGSDFSGFYNQSEGTLFVASERISTGVSYGTILRSSDGTANNRISLGHAGAPHNVEFFIATSGTGSFNQSTNTTAFKKMAGAYKSNDANYSVNGSIGTQDNTVVVPTVDRLEFGSGIVIQSARYFRKRLPNAKIQTITV